MAPSPARLSSLSTSLLTSLVELSRLQSLSLPAPPSAQANVLRNLTSLRSGILTLQAESSATDGEIVEELRKQYGRLTGLVAGMGMEEDVRGLALDETPAAEGMNGSADGEGEEDGDKTPRPRDPPVGDLLGDSGATPQPRGASWEQSSRLEDGMPKRSSDRQAMPNREELREDEADIRQQNHDVQLMQRTMMEDQDRSLDALSLAISRQRDLSLHISSELETQEALLEGLDEDLDHTDSRLRRASNKLDRFARKTRENGATCTIVGLIVLLLILIIVLK